MVGILKDIYADEIHPLLAAVVRTSGPGCKTAVQPGSGGRTEADSSGLESETKQLALSVSGTPDERFNGLYRQDVNNPIGNGQPHFSNVQGMHLFFGTVRGWCESSPVVVGRMYQLSHRLVSSRVSDMSLRLLCGTYSMYNRF